jgi:hypothetical protein
VAPVRIAVIAGKRAAQKAHPPSNPSVFQPFINQHEGTDDRRKSCESFLQL